MLYDITRSICVSATPDTSAYATGARMTAAEQDIAGIERQLNQTAGAHTFCTICGAQQYVSRPCTASVGTTCSQCATGTYSRYPHSTRAPVTPCFCSGCALWWTVIRGHEKAHTTHCNPSLTAISSIHPVAVAGTPNPASTAPTASIFVGAPRARPRPMQTACFAISASSLGHRTCSLHPTRAPRARRIRIEATTQRAPRARKPTPAPLRPARPTLV